MQTAPLLEFKGRYKKAVLSPEIIAVICTPWGVPVTCVQGLPKTAVPVTTRYNRQTNAFEILFKDDSFEMVYDYGDVPVIEVVWEASS